MRVVAFEGVLLCYWTIWSSCIALLFSGFWGDRCD